MPPSSSSDASRTSFLHRMQQAAPPERALPPAYVAPPTSAPDLLDQFCDATRAVGGEVERISSLHQLAPLLDQYASDSERLVASGLPAAGIQPADTDTAHALRALSTVVLRGCVAVAEDASVLVPDLDALGPAAARLRGAAFLAVHMVLVVDASDVVPTLHHAFSRPEVAAVLSETGFAVWVSGPSKTADIEQTLVHGAHGPERLTVILVGE